MLCVFESMMRLASFCVLAALSLGTAMPPPRARPAVAANVVCAGLCTPFAADAAADPVSSAPPPPAFALPPEPPPPPPPPAVAMPDVTAGPVHVVVSLAEQKAFVFKAGRLVATSPVSTGKRGHETPTGTFPIMEKQVHHRSNRYSNAPMPYMQRLTAYGVALHAGHLPGYPASHGCIRLPWGFAKRLYGMTGNGTVVTVTRGRAKARA
jgi:hypothetical protein